MRRTSQTLFLKKNLKNKININKGIRFLCTCAQCAHDRVNSKTGTPFLYSKSIGVFNAGIGFFSIRLAESNWFGLIETA